VNARLEEISVSKADLIDGDELPECLLDLVAHVASYRAVFASWQRGDFSVHTAPLNYPGESVVSYAEEHFGC